MTNTNDFRRYSYSGDASYAIEAFELKRNSAAPKMKPQQQPIKVRENTSVKSLSQLQIDQKSASKSVVKILAISIICLALLASVITSFAVKNQLTKEISAKQTQLVNAQSENISLNSKLDSLVSMSMIDSYAVEKLGMVKVKSSQIQYIDVNEYKAQRAEKLKNSSPKAVAEQLTSNKY